MILMVLNVFKVNKLNQCEIIQNLQRFPVSKTDNLFGSAVHPNGSRDIFVMNYLLDEKINAKNPFCLIWIMNR